MACDHYRRWAEDIALMKSMGFKVYRLAAAWPRILAAGTGEVNQKGLDFYSQVVDGLLVSSLSLLYHPLKVPDIPPRQLRPAEFGFDACAGGGAHVTA